MKVEVVPHHPEWKEQFEKESSLILAAFNHNQIDSENKNLIKAIHHIGSTSIPGIYAKPIIDILVEVTDIQQVEVYNPQMVALGYGVMGESGISGRRYFRKEVNEIRTHHVHIYEVNSEHIIRHLKFRDYVIAHPHNAQIYGDLKRDLAVKFPYDIKGYMDGKDKFIKQMEVLALAWK